MEFTPPTKLEEGSRGKISTTSFTKPQITLRDVENNTNFKTAQHITQKICKFTLNNKKIYSRFYMFLTETDHAERIYSAIKITMIGMKLIDLPRQFA